MCAPSGACAWQHSPAANVQCPSNLAKKTELAAADYTDNTTCDAGDCSCTPTTFPSCGIKTARVGVTDCTTAPTNVGTTCTTLPQAVDHYQLDMMPSPQNCTPQGTAGTYPNVTPGDPYTICCP
jgi:hypothetical protein